MRKQAGAYKHHGICHMHDLYNSKMNIYIQDPKYSYNEHIYHSKGEALITDALMKFKHILLRVNVSMSDTSLSYYYMDCLTVLIHHYNPFVVSH